MNQRQTFDSSVYFFELPQPCIKHEAPTRELKALAAIGFDIRKSSVIFPGLRNLSEASQVASSPASLTCRHYLEGLRGTHIRQQQRTLCCARIAGAEVGREIGQEKRILEHYRTFDPALTSEQTGGASGRSSSEWEVKCRSLLAINVLEGVQRSRSRSGAAPYSSEKTSPAASEKTRRLTLECHLNQFLNRPL